jgi:hypothetical protein
MLIYCNYYYTIINYSVAGVAYLPVEVKVCFGHVNLRFKLSGVRRSPLSPRYQRSNLPEG